METARCRGRGVSSRATPRPPISILQCFHIWPCGGVGRTARPPGRGRAGLLAALLLLAAVAVRAEGIVAKKALRPDPAAARNLLANPGLEEGPAAPIHGWQYWDRGYEIDAGTAHTGRRSLRCRSADTGEQRGLSQTITLNQEKPLPILAECYSKAEGVTGSPAANYSLYLDLEYAAGTPLWGQTGNFSCGTHDWERQRVLVVPTKPIRSVTVHGIFGGRTGTAWFDTLSLTEMKLPKGAVQFDTVPVAAATAVRKPLAGPLRIRTPDGFALALDPATGQAVGPDGRRGGFYVRDVAAESDFRQPLGRAVRKGHGVSWEGSDLGLKLTATYSVLPAADGGHARGGIRVDGMVEDLEKRDRAVTVTFALPLDAIGWRWSEELRRDVSVEPGKTYFRGVPVGAGATGSMSWYPLACVSGEREGMAIATPLDVPRLSRLCYDSESRELYAAFDFGLTPDTARFPSRASFSFVLYGFDPRWRMRAALQGYYDLFPGLFTKRVKREGLWMAFTDIAHMPGFEDFHFAFQEGGPNIVFDDAHGILSFIYVEPTSHWLSMPLSAPRTPEGAMAVLEEDLAGGRDVNAREMAAAMKTSCIQRGDGTDALIITKAPWCDGALFLLNPDPDIATTPTLPRNKSQVMLQTVDAAFNRIQAMVTGWGVYGAGYDTDAAVRRSGERAARCEANDLGREIGCTQIATLSQREAKPLVVRAWSKAENVSGEPDNSYAIYVDLAYTDGTPHFGFVTPFSPGTHDWQQMECRIVPEKPVARAAVHLLFRRTHTGKVWFDDAFLAEEGSEKNLLENPGFEGEGVRGELDGTYLDSFEMGASDLNYRREHFRAADVPLVFDRVDRRPCQLLVFSTYEFEKEIAGRMHHAGKLLFANAVLWRFAFPAHLLDVLGTEINWMPGGQYRPDGDDLMCFRRALCYRKPYCFLMNTDYAKLTPEYVERYMKRCVFYGMFPGFFDEEAASKDPYWTSPKRWYERDRELFKRYVPLAVRLAQAGWSPVTNARTDNDRVYVERYGPGAGGEVYLALYNDSGEKQAYRLSVDLAALSTGGPMKAQDVLEMRDVTLGADGTLSGELGPEDLKVVRLSNRPDR